jgi:hypothetical protein
VKFCIENWDNGFIKQIKKEMADQAELLALL